MEQRCYIESEPHTPLQIASTIKLSDSGTGPPVGRETCHVIVEAPLVIDVANVGTFTVMALPQNRRFLAVGFLLAEGIIDKVSDMALLNECPDDPNVIRIQLTNPGGKRTPNRNLVVTSSCGLCGNTALEQLLDSLGSAPDTLRVSSTNIHGALNDMYARQELFKQSGGTHAAAIFDCHGEIIAFAEDIGRHNALDKVIGQCLLEGRDGPGCGVALSGRVSLELVVKCARAGIELIAAISAPTSLAIAAAEKCNICLCAYARKDRLTVFMHPHRVMEID